MAVVMNGVLVILESNWTATNNADHAIASEPIGSLVSGVGSEPGRRRPMLKRRLMPCAILKGCSQFRKPSA